jgi:hypothetical protein
MANQQALSKPAVPTVTDAEQTVARLQEQREQVVAARAKAEADTGHHAFAAHARGDMAAVEALDQIAADIARHDARLREIGLALAEAGRILQDARQAEAQAANRRQAEELSTHLRELAPVFEYVDKHLAAALKGLLAHERGVTELHQKGVEFPTGVQLRLGMVAVLGTFLQQLPKTWWNEISAGQRYRAPNERKTALSYFAQIEPSLRNAIAQAVGADVSKAPAMQRSDAHDRREAAAAAREFLNGGA